MSGARGPGRSRVRGHNHLHTSHTEWDIHGIEENDHSGTGTEHRKRSIIENGKLLNAERTEHENYLGTERRKCCYIKIVPTYL